METHDNHKLTEHAEGEGSFIHEMHNFVYRQMDKFNGVRTREQLFDVTKSVLEGLGKFFSAERVFFYQKYNESHVRHVKYGWRDWNRINRNLNEDECARQLITCYYSQLESDKNVVICDIETIRDQHPSLYRPLCVNDVHDWVAVPLFKKGTLDGVLSIVNPDMRLIDSLIFLLRGTVHLFSLYHQSVNEIDSLQRMISMDQLTGLDNRLRGEQLVMDSLERGENGTFFLFDCDNFKQVNERFGHQVGDRLLIETSKTLRQLFPQGFLFRLGSDEFGAFFPLMSRDRSLLSHWVYQFYYLINRMKVEGLSGYRISFSVGAIVYGEHEYTAFDQIYQKTRSLCRDAKEYEGNYVMTEYGGIPDLETAFYLLREDRHLYDHLNDDLFKVTDQASWLRYLDNCARLKSDMCWRNQCQYEQILNYFASGNAVEIDYNHLYDLVLRFRNSLDAFMVETLVGDILLPHYEELYESGNSDIPDNILRGHLAKLYLHLGDSLVGIYLMGDSSHPERIHEMFDRCIEISKPLKNGDPAYEYQVYALCQLVGHYEFFEHMIYSPEQYDEYYLQLRRFVVGPDAVTLRDPILLPYYTYLLQNARCYPVLRAAQLGMKGEKRTPEETREFIHKLHFIRTHSVEDVLDSSYPVENMLRLERLLHSQLFGQKTTDDLFEAYNQELHFYKENQKALYNTADLMGFQIMMLASMNTIDQCNKPIEEKRLIVMEWWDLFLLLYKHRKNEATDRQTWYMACYLLSLFISNPMLTSQDKRDYLIRTIGVLMLDTYSHSKAMYAYAQVIMNNIIEQRPELLVGSLKNTGTVKQVKANRKKLLEFMETACMIHDIGKLAQIPIITNSYRKLTEHEFQILRLHPSAGRGLLSAEPYFSQFDDIIEGHHSSFDGKTGYPQSYLLSHPEQHILVDILSICDSLEAATSQIGRNYRVAKNFSQLMDEFYAQAGTRYNPQVLESIISSRETYNLLKWMVDSNWKSIYQTIYQEIVSGEVPQEEQTSQMTAGEEASYSDANPSRVHVDKTLGVDQLRRIANQQEEHNRWLTQQLVESVESKYEYDQVTKGLHAIFEVMALVKVKDGSIKILQGHPDFLRIFPPTQYHPVKAMTDFSVEHVVKPKWTDKLIEFNDYTTLADRLKGRKSINLELETQIEGWTRFSYCPAEYDETGNLEKALFTAENINEEVINLQRLKFVAEYDGLTGVLSRYGGERQIRDMLDKQTAGLFAVLDIDHFKSFNDTYGHVVGDKVLSAIGKVLRMGLNYTIIRQGGDEFVAFCNSDETEAEHRQRIDSLFQHLSSIDIPELNGQKITASVGAVIYDGSEPVTFDELFRIADHLLYVSKRYEGNYLSIERY